MDNKDCSPKKKHLTPDERSKIEILLKLKKRPSEISRELGRDRSVISREIKRNRVVQRDSKLREHHRYFADAATRQYKERRERTGCKYKLSDATELIDYVEMKVKTEKWSPDAAIGRAKLEQPGWITISTKTYYNYIDLGLVKVKPIDLQLKLRLNPKKKRIKERKKHLGRSIDERPKEVNERQEFGHWEGDTIIGKREKSSVLMTLTERKTGSEVIRKISGKSSQAVILALETLKKEFGEKCQTIFKSVTFDNGSEFSDSMGMEKALGATVYFAHPYSSFERGTNENHNGIIRRFIPKGKSIDDVSEATIARIEAFMNNLPRKRFGYRTPREYMNSLLMAV
jgi:IS30 family transposase